MCVLRVRISDLSESLLGPIIAEFDSSEKYL